MSLQEFLLLPLNENVQITIKRCLTESDSIDVSFINLKNNVRVETVNLTPEYMDRFSLTGIINRSIQKLKK